MDNAEIADILNRMGRLLEFMGGDPFKIMAYEKAARSIKRLEMDISSIHQEGHLSDVPNVGKAIEEKIEELLTKGTFEAYEKTLAEIPPGIIEIMDISGIGPKTAKILYERLAIESTGELIKAAEEHRIRRLPRMGPKQEERILKAARNRVQSSDFRRTPLAVATAIEQQITEKLSVSPYIKKVVPVGSLRRKMETVGNIDLFALSDEPEKAIDAFMHLGKAAPVPEIRNLHEGSAHAAIVHENGIRIDLYVCSGGCCGSLMQYLTGSKEHNVRLQEVARAQGYTVSEKGLICKEKSRDEEGLTNEAGEFSEEADIYELLGLGYLPPELREDRGEVEAGLERRLPVLIERKDIKGDLHVHSRWSDGRNTIEELALHARGLGYEYIAITDHSPSTGVANGLSEQRLLDHIREIDEINDRIDGIRLLSGTECDIRSDGRLDYSSEVLEGLDIVVVAVHAGLEQDRKSMTKRVIAALENEHVDILAHPTGRKFGKRSGYDIDMEKVMQAAFDNDKVLEINSSPSRLDLNDMHARMAKEVGVKIAINTDTHSLAHFDNIDYGIDVARRAWLEPADVVNTRGLKEICSMLRI
ncbi:MAG: DNA polymerase/3'-5' exonuclease PolX [Methanolobus sp.]|uniref:DNA polymerase/3'-5' exonuclease PolX n=1 Tax=Methanolobus sp. TaxID=1874737 RepID=UPI00273035BB|nr:DNA polymerase/3'-5' exonuclease PolX [Methanolobus sp.]MDP2216785.1 DNA polymerase/3'-5' exonuclease PolX [Methanolobus sp.]